MDGRTDGRASGLGTLARRGCPRGPTAAAARKLLRAVGRLLGKQKPVGRRPERDMGVFFLSVFRTLAPRKEAAGAGRCFRSAPGLRGGPMPRPALLGFPRPGVCRALTCVLLEP